MDKAAVKKDRTIREALQLLLDQVDYMSDNCQVNQMVGAVLPVQVIEICRKALEAQPIECKHDEPGLARIKLDMCDCDSCVQLRYGITKRIVKEWLATDPPLDSSDIGMLIDHLEEKV